MLIDKFNPKLKATPQQKRQLGRAFNQYIHTATPQRDGNNVLDGIEPQQPEKPQEPQKRRLSRSDKLNSCDFMNEKFSIIEMTGRWRKLIGRPQSDAQIMFYGRPGNGKSTLAIQFAAYVSRTLGYKTLYVSAEEGFRYSFQEKLQRLGAANPNLTITGECVPANFAPYKFIFIDSVNYAGLSPEDLRALPPDKFYVYVFQTTKSGAFRGSQEYLHDVDVEVFVENMKAVPRKNRFGGYEEIDVLPPRQTNAQPSANKQSKIERGRKLLAETLAGLE